MTAEIEAFWRPHYFVFTWFLNKVFPTSNIKVCQLYLYSLFLNLVLPICANPIRQVPIKISATGSETKFIALPPLNKMAARIIINIINFIFLNTLKLHTQLHSNL
jgi:hypothetical protein